MNSLVALLVLASIRPVQVGVPNRQPQLAAANGVVALVFGSGHSVMFAQSNDNGQTFPKPVSIAEPAVLALGRHRGPRIVFSGKICWSVPWEVPLWQQANTLTVCLPMET